MSQFSARAFAFSDTYDDERYPLGTRRWEDARSVKAANSTHTGDRQWIFVKANAALVAGNTVQRADGLAYEGVVGTALAAPRILGVAQNAIASGKYGWIVRNGACEVLAGTITANAIIKAVAAGSASDHASGTDDDNVIGFALEAGSTALTACVITLP